MGVENKEELVSFLEDEIQRLERRLNYYRNLLDVIQKVPKEKKINEFSKAIFGDKKIIIKFKKQVLKEEELKKMLNYYDVKIDGMKVISKNGFLKKIIINADPVAYAKIKSLIREILKEGAIQ